MTSTDEGGEQVKVSRRARVRQMKNAAKQRRTVAQQIFAGREVVSVHRFGRVGAFENRVAKRHAARKAAGRARRASR